MQYGPETGKENNMTYGIDYGNRKTNIDLETGIRFGVIPMHEVTQAWCDDAEPVYPSRS